MPQTVIQIKDLSKRYRLGVIGGKRLVDDFNRQWARIRGKPDPRSKVGTHNTANAKSRFSNITDDLWALKDVSFEIKEGEVLGIIGRNGAGKSTLLKILSRVTAPTSGEVRVKGRIASLLEVGTGFHPELTGRENIFLNGAILGMTKDEIKKKFDEIVDFSEVERFIDTPVKRYSSGMYVRLAFAVAAHLDPEILIVDEVLAVGDFEFQKKCLGKMGDVARGGRTVLFVSHNMASIRSLSTKAVTFVEGKLIEKTSVAEAIEHYLNAFSDCEDLSEIINGDAGRGDSHSLVVQAPSRRHRMVCGESLVLRVKFTSHVHTKKVALGVLLRREDETALMGMDSYEQGITSREGLSKTWSLQADLGKIPINSGRYFLDLYVSSDGTELAKFSKAVYLEVLPADVFSRGKAIPDSRHWGNFYWTPEWTFEPQD